MRDKADRAFSLRGFRAAEAASYALIAGAVVLGWQVLIQPVLQRAPVAIALRLAPASPQVLTRAAEAELSAGRNDNAASLARDALARSPFNVRALRVFGLTEARAGREREADDILTLAGNWSLRDDPSHAWLIEHRLRAGDYVSAFAHADTLVRRREDIQPQVFNLFTTAGREDPRRSLPVLANLLAARPPWRQAYLVTMDDTPETLQLKMNLAILLQSSQAPLTNLELQRLYRSLVRAGYIDAVQTLRTRLNRPAVGPAVTNGGFDEPAAPEPFEWRLTQKAGVLAEIVADDVRAENSALRVDYGGSVATRVVEQMTTLSPGQYRFSARVKVETGNPLDRFYWTVTCAAGDRREIASIPVRATDTGPNTWMTLSGDVAVPAGCVAQWLRLETRTGDRRAPTAIWFDEAKISTVD